MKFKLLIVTSVLIVIGCTSKNDVFIKYSNPNIDYSGRIDSVNANGVDLWWSGSSIKLNFEGESVQALLKDSNGDNYYNVIIDDSVFSILRPDTVKQFYTLAHDLSFSSHTLEIFKRTEWDRGKTTFYGFSFDKNTKILPKKTYKKRIEFYGNSITAGYAVEDFSGDDSPDSIFTNNYLSYAAITARHFNAEYSCICKSGIGVMVSWFPLIMPEIYNRQNPTDSNSFWDFSLYTPNVVVINLFQNDSWIVTMPDNSEFKSKFGTTPPSDKFIVNAYKDFISSIRNQYPNAEIICMLGNMDITNEGSKWPDYVKTAVDELADNKLYTYFVKYKDSPGHPTIKEHEDMAKGLIDFIDNSIDW